MPHEMSFFGPFSFSSSCSRFSSSSWYSRALRTFIADARFLICERSFWQVTMIPVGSWTTRTAEYVVLTPWPPGPDEQ